MPGSCVGSCCRPPPLVHTRLPRATPSITPQSVVSKRIPQPRAELSPQVREHEARLLAVMLRTSRLTWVFAEAGTDSPTLLKSGVMPLLQRRSGDRLAPASVSAERPVAPDRRPLLANLRARPRREAVIYFDTWGEAPLSQLKRRIDDIVPAGMGGGFLASRGSLIDALQRLNQNLGLQVIVVLNRFEEFLALPPNASEVEQFANEWVAAVVNQDLPASFLVSMDESARPQLERFRARLPGFDDNVLRLSPVADPSDLPDLPAEHWRAIVGQGPAPEADRPAGIPSPLRTGGPASEPPRRGPPARVPVNVGDVYALIESTLARTTADGQLAPRRAEVDIDVSAPAAGAPAAIVPLARCDDSPVAGWLKRRR